VEEERAERAPVHVDRREAMSRAEGAPNMFSNSPSYCRGMKLMWRNCLRIWEGSLAPFDS